MASYEYFSGANVIIRVGGQPILEVAGISYQETDTQMPIYGYGSRFFDAVAPGQKLIRGSFVINFVRPDYLAYAIARGRDIEEGGVSSYAPGVDVGELLNKSRINALDGDKNTKNQSIYQTNSETYQSIEESAAQKVIESVGKAAWDEMSPEDKATKLKLEALNNIAASNYAQTQSNMASLSRELQRNMPSNYVENTYGTNFKTQMSTKAIKDITMNTAFNIDIVFGGNKCVIKLLDCYISSRGAMIQIDESTLVEEYSFFARNLKTLRLDTAQKL